MEKGTFKSRADGDQRRKMKPEGFQGRWEGEE